MKLAGEDKMTTGWRHERRSPLFNCVFAFLLYLYLPIHSPFLLNSGQSLAVLTSIIANSCSSLQPFFFLFTNPIRPVSLLHVSILCLGIFVVPVQAQFLRGWLLHFSLKSKVFGKRRSSPG